MAKALKDAGLEELEALRRRVIRQHGLKRIKRKDRDRLVELLDKMEAHIIRMDEDDGKGGVQGWL